MRGNHPAPLSLFASVGRVCFFNCLEVLGRPYYVRLMKAIDPAQLRRTIFALDGLSYTFAMAEIVSQRLRSTVAQIDENAVEELKVSALLDAWTMIDAAHRARGLIQSLAGYRAERRPGGRVFLDATAAVEDLRNFIQHLREEIGQFPEKCPPLWGSLSWAASDGLTNYFLIPGNLQPGIGGETLTFDWDEGEFVSKMVLFAGEHSVALDALATNLERLRADIRGWVAAQAWHTRKPEPMKTTVFKWTIPKKLADERRRKPSK
jgi:hypothetical protein